MAVTTAVKRATLFDPATGKRVAVDVGSQTSRELFGQGFQLETPTNYYQSRNLTLNAAPQQSPLPILPGEREALINKYVSSGYGLDKATSRVNDLWKNRPLGSSPTYPRSLVFGPTGESLPTTVQAPAENRVAGYSKTIPTLPQIKSPAQSFQEALMGLLQEAQGKGGNEDLLKQRNALVEARFGAYSKPTPSDLQMLTPEQQSSLRGLDARGIEEQLGGVDAAIRGRQNRLNQMKELVDLSVKLTGGSEDPTSIKEYKFAVAQGYMGTLNDWKNGGGSGLSERQTSVALKLSDDYEKASQDNREVAQHYNRIRAGQKNPNAVSDMSLIFAFMKMLDPRSVVRESEYATAANAGSIPERVWGQYNRAVNGERLAPTVRADFIAQAHEIYAATQKQQAQIDKAFTNKAVRFGVPSNLIIYPQLSYLDSEDAAKASGGGEQDFQVAGYSETRAAGGSEEERKRQVTQIIKEGQLKGKTNEQILNKLKQDGLWKSGSTVSVISIPENKQPNGRNQLAYLNNNPGNLKYVGQAGARKGVNGFASFKTPEDGYKALKDQIALDARRGMTLRQFVNKYAPPSENNTQQYLQQIASQVGAKPDTKIATIDREVLARAVAFKESNTFIV